MPDEPSVKRTLAFVDGQNLYHAAQEAFGYSYPNFDTLRLSQRVCAGQGWQLQQVRFYTGVPERSDNPLWNHFWREKLGAMGRQGVHVFSRHLRYRNQTVLLPDGTAQTVLVGREKGIDVRISLDVVHAARTAACDVVLLFSQDQDLSEVADEVRLIARDQNRWLKIASAFPFSPASRNRRGIDRTDWVRIDRATYEACIDPRDYRPRRP